MIEANRPTVTLSAEADNLYEALILHADESGFIGFQGSLEISVQHGVEVSETIKELQRQLLVFHATERAGWIVRMPVRNVELATS